MRRRIDVGLRDRRAIEAVDKFQVLFSGQVSNGATEAAVRTNLARKLAIDDRKASRLFSGRTVVLKSDLSRAAAEQMQRELAELGAVARIKNLSSEERARFKVDERGRRDRTLKDITAAHVECPRCGHLQLEAEHCARCGVEIAAALKQKQREDLLIEKKIRELRDRNAR